jgi:hypothetical protein
LAAAADGLMNDRTGQAAPDPKRPRRQRYVAAVGPRLRRLLAVVLGLFALIGVNSVYLVSVTAAGVEYQSWFYLLMFAAHLGLGLAVILPVVVFGLIHLRNARNRRNRRAIRVGYALFATALLLLASGLVLTRVDLFGARFEVNDPAARSAAYWVHVGAPLAVIWLFVLHRLAGRRIKWKVGLAWAGVAAAFAAGMLLLHSQDPRGWNVAGPQSGEQYFFPSLARTSSGNFIPAEVLSNDGYCRECHADIHDGWAHSVHKFSSFNNPPYEFSVKNTRRVLMERDGNVQASRFCAGCHDPVPFFSGAFDDPKFDDPDYDLASDTMAQAGITCTVCHSIVHVNSVRGNADFTIDEPVHYPFAFSDADFPRWLSRQLVKAKPEFHKATFLKPLHRSTEFCGTCHKVHLPAELNGYKWLRGQNHHDAFWLSGVSGHGVSSFYYPPKAQENCNGCHMPLVEVSDAPNFASAARDDSGLPKTFDHQFPSANTAIPHLLRNQMSDADTAIEAHREFVRDVMRVDLFGVKTDGRIDGELQAPIRPDIPVLQPGRSYLLEVVIRTVKMGHLFTQGTADSNQIWLEITATSGNRVVGQSGTRRRSDNAVDPWSHFVNAFVIDREGRRIDRRNAEDIFVALYNNQIPPGAADVVHYRLELPPDLDQPVTVKVKLLYRKFDTEYMRLVVGDENYYNDLPILTLAEDEVTLRVSTADRGTRDRESTVAAWERWNDYGIGLLRKGRLGELAQAARAFARVEELGRADGPLNLARVYIKEGLVQTHAPEALKRAAESTPPANAWSLLWFGALVAEANGDYDLAIANLREVVRGGFAQAEGRGFDFSKDYRVLNALGNALYQRGLQESGDQREPWLLESRERFLEALSYDPENLAAHWGLTQVSKILGDVESERRHAEFHARYKPDDNARDHAVAQSRMNYPAANKASEAIVIYDLHRPEGETWTVREPDDVN